MPTCTLLRAAARRAVLGLGLAGAPIQAQQPGDAPYALTLRQAIDLALRQGYQARAAQATRDAARYRNRAFNGRFLPQLSLGGTVPAYAYNRSIIQVVQPDGSTLFRPQDQTSTALTATLSQVLPLTGGDLSVSSSLSRLEVTGQQEVRTWSSTPVLVSLRQPLLRPNASAWNRREEVVRSDLAERQYREASEDVALQLANLFFDVYAAQVALETATANAARNDTLYRLNTARLEIGRIGENDLLQSELALLRARTALDAAKLEYLRAMAALRLGLNLPSEAALEIVVPADVPTLDPDTARAVAQALANRAVVSELDLQQVQARRRVTEAKLSNWLGANLVASYGFNASGSDANLAYQNLLEAQRLTIGVEVPLLQWGVRKGSVEAAEADHERVEYVTRATLDETAHEARFAALQLSQARRNLTLSAKGDSVAGKRFEVAYNRYLIGRITLDNLFIAQNEQDQARTQYVQALRRYWQAYYTLRRTTLFDFESNQEIRE
jgi:outer membrane protein TolC